MIEIVAVYELKGQKMHLMENSFSYNVGQKKRENNIFA